MLATLASRLVAVSYRREVKMMPDKKKSEIEPEIEAETQEAPPAEDETPDEEIGEEVEEEEVDTKVVKKPVSETEEVWDDLSGSTQNRIIQLVRRAKEAEAKLEGSRYQPASNPPVESQAPSTEEVKEAVSKLRGYGVVTQEDLRAVQDRLYLDREHDHLKDKFNGSDGRPKYVSEEVEDYARTHYYGGNLEAAFNDMYRDELIDFEVKARGGEKKKIITEKPTASVKIGEKPLTRESLQERLRQPDGVEWWAKNREKIEPLLKKLSQA